ncbi:MAG: hypothetical protein ACRDD2_02245 [Sarcina sp.]
MSEVTIDGKKYKELKIKNLIINGEIKEGFTVDPEQLDGHGKVQVTIEAEKSEPENVESVENLEEQN